MTMELPALRRQIQERIEEYRQDERAHMREAERYWGRPWNVSYERHQAGRAQAAAAEMEWVLGLLPADL